RADRAQLFHAADELARGQVYVVDRQHRHELQPLRAELAELVDPVVVGLAQAERELGIEVIAGNQGEAGRRGQHPDVDPLHTHAAHLGLGVVRALDREVEAAGIGQTRAGQGLGAVRAARTAALPVLLHLGVHRGGQTVDDDRAPPGLAVGPDHGGDAVFEPLVQVAVEQIDQLHDVHVAVNEAKPVFHDVLPGVAMSPLSLRYRLARLYPAARTSQAFQPSELTRLTGRRLPR